MYLHNRWIISL